MALPGILIHDVYNMKLTPKQELFCREYLIDLNASQAAIRAGYSIKTAYSIGQENLNKPEIQEQIRQLMDKRTERTQVDADKVITELAKLAFSNMKDYVEFDGKTVTLKDSKDLTTDQMACVFEVSDHITQTTRTRKFKLHDKLKALDSLSRHLGLYESDKAPAVNVNVGINIDNMSPGELEETGRRYARMILEVGG